MSTNYVPNRNCCTDPRYLCARCSAAACEQAGNITNAQGYLFRNRKVDPKAVLPRLTINWSARTVNNQTKHSDCACAKQSHVTNLAGLSHSLSFTQRT